jgi:LysR family hca operon transcriptional activator
MELRHLRYFVAVVEEGSLSTAAELRLHTSQPSLSRQIRDLEYQVGAELLSRSVHGVELTAAGKAFLDHARLALMQVEAAVEAARRAAQPARKTFAIGFQTGHEMNWLPRAMHVLRDELKNIEVTVSSDYSPDLAEALVRGRLDLAFLRVEPGYDLGYHVVDHEPLIVLMPSDHRLTAREAVRPQDFVGEIFIGGANKAAVLRAVTEDYLRRAGRGHQARSRRGQHGDGHVPGRLHPRTGADARLCQEPAAVVRGQSSAGRRGADDRGSGGLQQVEQLTRPEVIPISAGRID